MYGPEKVRQIAQAKRIARMPDHARIVRLNNDRVFNSQTGEYDEGTLVVYEGPCHLKPYAPGQRMVDAGFAELVVGMYEVILPYSEDYYIGISDTAIVNGHSYPVNSVDVSHSRNGVHIIVVDQGRATAQYA